MFFCGNSYALLPPTNTVGFMYIVVILGTINTAFGAATSVASGVYNKVGRPVLVKAIPKTLPIIEKAVFEAKFFRFVAVSSFSY